MELQLSKPLDHADWTGEAGRAWAARCAPYRHLFGHCDEAITLLRRRRIEAGVALLQRVEEELKNVDDPILESIVNRFYFGAMGFYYYLVEDFDAARRTMDLACRSIASAIEHGPFFLLMAHNCREMVLHQARIDRNRRAWDSMEHHIRQAREMTEESRPLCVLSDGTGVTYGDLARFLEAHDGVSDADRESLAPFLDPRVRSLLFESFVRGFVDPPGFVVPAA